MFFTWCKCGSRGRGQTRSLSEPKVKERNQGNLTEMKSQQIPAEPIHEKNLENNVPSKILHSRTISTSSLVSLKSVQSFYSVKSDNSDFYSVTSDTSVKERF
ncbi:uncharacterized protein [Euwallacea similis]|uniref:uncharacterized protein n=1 Tax=Euwallacea similis TaxID=1736056 RepID=UPI0034506ED9